ncbi:lipoate--protein ligase family protein [Candidatus Woesearchaeota archaeon]|nr:lipoate--protein ligase family protein [Candidatus Woesearchaeota archaeon]
MKCRFIDTKKVDAFTNMAVDEALLSSKVPVLRLYQWNPSVSLGYNQDVKKEIDLDYCKKNNVDVVRRITGGKAVFHDKELTYSFIVPENTGILSKDLIESYKQISEALVLALGKIGINAEIKKANKKINNAVCFNSSNWYELEVNGKKIVGSAQRRINGKVLQHGSILLAFDHEKNSKIFKTGNGIETLKSNITAIKEELGKNIETENLKKEIKIAFGKKFGFEIVDSELSEEETNLTEQLVKEKYSKNE